MARGWESKSVESQIETEVAKEPPPEGKHPLTDEERRAKRERDNLILARARVLQQLEAASNERYKELLRRELSELETRINGAS